MGAVKTRKEPLNFETVWAAIMELRESQKETERQMKETDRQIKETGLQIKETGLQMKETGLQMKETDRKLGSMTNLFGDVTEAMIAPKICEKFEDKGLVFPKANQNSRINDRVNKIAFETDIMLENGEKAMLIEVKTKLTIERIDKHLERMKKMRAYADLHGDKRRFLGAVAGIVVPDDVREYALEQGFYLIEPSGESFNITLPNGQPKEW